jgi:putative addiction module component (TIGR02574 family)
MQQVFALPAGERFALAQQLLDSIDDSSAQELDAEFVAELERRHEEMVRGESIVEDWRGAIAEIKESLARKGDSGSAA